MRASYAIEQRLRLIDFLLAHYGFINRAQLQDYFGISKPQAATDFALYLKYAPGNMTYNLSAKRYEAAPNMARLYP